MAGRELGSTQKQEGPEELFSDLVSFFEKEGQSWTRDGESTGRKFITALWDCLWYVDGLHQTLADRSHPIPVCNVPDLTKHLIQTCTEEACWLHQGISFESMDEATKEGYKKDSYTEQQAESVDGYTFGELPNNWLSQLMVIH